MHLKILCLLSYASQPYVLYKENLKIHWISLVPCTAMMGPHWTVFHQICFKNIHLASLAGVVQLVGVPSHAQKVAVWFLVKAHTWIAVLSSVQVHVIPGLGTCGRQPIDAPLLHQCFSLFLPLPPKAIKNVLSWGLKKIKNILLGWAKMVGEWVEVTLIASQEQSEITNKLWRNHPEVTALAQHNW